MFVNTQLILVFLIGSLETLNIFIQSKKKKKITQKVLQGQQCHWDS